MPDRDADVYCIDSSVILNLWKKNGSFPKDVHATLWEKINEYIKNKRIISSIEVYEELKEESDPDLVQWLRENKDIFIDIDECQIGNLKMIVQKYPMLAEGFTGKADHVLVSLSMCRNLVVLSSEKKSSHASPFTPKIPNLCADFSVDCVDINDFLRKENISI